MGRIAMLEKGEPLPNDILSRILQVASELVCNSQKIPHNVIYVMQMLVGFIGKEETSDIETLVDDFMVFFFAGKQL